MVVTQNKFDAKSLTGTNLEWMCNYCQQQMVMTKELATCGNNDCQGAILSS